MKKLLFKLGMLTGIAFALTSCYPGGADYTSDTDVVVTDYDPEYSFNSIQTYFLSDSINHIVEDGETIDYKNDAYVISELQKSFDALGWTRLDSTNSTPDNPPDVAVVVTAAKVTNYNYYGYPWYPYWGWGWYWKSTKETQYYGGYPGYGWGYPYYPTYVTSYETGTLNWYLFDPDKVDEENETIKIEWIGLINGVLGSSNSSTLDRVSTGIEQAFKQSPYLSAE